MARPMIPGPEAYEFYTTAQQTIAPSCVNQITVGSLKIARTQPHGRN